MDDARPESQGLSPRVRGNLPGHGNQDDGEGSIPASAGEPWTWRPPPWNRWVYPRECGGTQIPESVRIVDGRSIPASAGEPHAGMSARSICWVYPRECGGTLTNPEHGNCRKGLSPRVRGNRHRSGGEQQRIRSIPASAGEPISSQCNRSNWTVYPRECGGTIHRRYSNGGDSGLSPRVRGNHVIRMMEGNGWRSIPASAGEPSPRRCTGRRPRVYPRECGGT